MFPTGFGYGYSGWGDAAFGSAWSCADRTATMSVSGSYPGSTPVSGSYPGSTPLGGSYPGSTPVSGSYPGSTPVSGSYPGSTPLGGSYPGSTPVSGSYPGSTPVSGSYPGSTPVSGSYPGSTPFRDQTVTTSFGDGTMLTSMGDTSRIDRLLGVADEEEYQDEYLDEDQDRDKSTIPLPEELIQMFQSQECKLCDVVLTSELTAYVHYEGKVHQKAVAAYMMTHYAVKGSLRKRRNKFQPVFCDVCKTTLTSQVVHDTHLAGKTHAKNLNRLVFRSAEPEMEDDVDFMFQPPPPPPPPKLNEFVCDVCHISTNTEHQLIIHKEGSKHRKKLREIERQAEEKSEEEYYEEMEDEENYDNTEDYFYGEEENNEDCDGGPVEHVEDPTMDLPLQFNSRTNADSRTVIRSEGSKAVQIADSKDEEAEAESAELWDFVVDLMHSDKTDKTTEQSEQPEKEDNPGTESRLEMDGKVNPGAANVLHKYKSALEAQKGDMITMVMPPVKSRIKKVAPKKPLYLPPEIRRRVGVTEQTVEIEDATGAAKFADGVINNSNKCSGSVDILKSPWKPYYNSNVDFHRRKSPSPEESIVGRGGQQNRRWQRYGSYGWGSQGYRRSKKKSCWFRDYGGIPWGRDGARMYDEQNTQRNAECIWYRGRMPQEQQYSSSRNRRRYVEDEYLHEQSGRGRHRRRIKSRTPESRYGWRHDESRRRVAAERFRRERSSGESTDWSSRSSRTRSLSSRSARGSRSVESASSDESSRTRSPRRNKYGRSRRSYRSRSRSRFSGDVHKYKSDDGSSRKQSTSSRKRRRKRERSWSDEGKRKKIFRKDKSARMKTENREERNIEQPEGKPRIPWEDIKVKEEEPIQLKEDLPRSFPKPILPPKYYL